MFQQALLGQVGILGSRTAIVGIRIDGDAPTRRKQPYHLNIFRIHQTHQIFHDGVDTILMKVPVVTEGKEV
jgi:hypothetical protein